MKLAGATVLITGANRGIGLHFAREVLARGARKVYGGARDITQIKVSGVEPVPLDVTQEGDVRAAANRCHDVTLLINNAGIGAIGGFLTAESIDAARRMLETNFFGVLRMSAAFAPVLGANGGGAILNVLSDTSWVSPPWLAAYGATKSAAWSLTNGLRQELRDQRTQVLALHMGFVDTDLTRGVDLPKSAPDVVVRLALDSLESGEEEVLADAGTREIKQGLSSDAPAYLSDRGGSEPLKQDQTGLRLSVTTIVQ